MSLHLAKAGSPFEAVCGGNAARTTADPADDRINCHVCLNLLGRGDRDSELNQVMIFRRQIRRLPDGCIHCGKSRTFCEALQDRRSGECCCWKCEVADRDPH